jgi:Ni/Fe-hydrogenase subunit HybB-like protein
MSAEPSSSILATTEPSPLLLGHQTYTTVTDHISDIVLVRKTGPGWILGAFMCFGIVNILMIAVAYLFYRGVGIWGIDVPVAWGFAIINFVWWIGIGHAGTLISAILLLLRQEWRTSINRFAEAMTIFAVMCAGMFPLLHTGRPWLAYWLIPYPNTMGIWPQFRSPLVWDVFAVSTYATISLLFWYVGMIPDLATIRDRSNNKIQQIVYGMLSLGWRGGAMHWQRYEIISVILAGLCTPLVVSVHTVVSWDFAVAIVPGWHTTIFPPYFVAGAIYSGFAMVLTLAIPLRAVYKLHNLLTLKHLENMAIVMLSTGLIVAYGYIVEIFMGFYGGNKYEMYMITNRWFGAYAPAYWMLIACNIAIPQLLWIKAVRINVPALFVMSLVVNTGMWLERFIIVVTSLHRDFMPSRWGMYYPTIWDYAIFLGTIGFFLFNMFLFARFIPMIAGYEMRDLVNKKLHRKGTPTGLPPANVGEI